MIYYRLVFFISLFITNFSNAQKLYANFDRIAITSVEILIDLNSSFQKDHYSEFCQYYVFRVLKSSKRNNIEFYVEHTYDGELVKNLNPYYYFKYKDNIQILIFDNSERINDLPLYVSDSVSICEPDYLIYSRNAKINLVLTPLIYHFNAKLFFNSQKIELSYFYASDYNISIKDRPIKKYTNTHPFKVYDTVRNHYLRDVSSFYKAFFGKTIPDSIYNNVINGNLIISLGDE